MSRAATINSMRLRLVHTLSLLLLSVVAVAVLAMGSAMAWSLRNGFIDYLAARDLDRLGQFVVLVEQRIASAGGLDALYQGQLAMRDILREFAELEGAPRDPPPGDDDVPGQGPQGRRPPPDRPPRADPLGHRFAVYGLDGRPLMGRPLPRESGAFIERPLRVQGELVGSVRMLRLPPASSAVDARFLRSQYVAIVTVAAGLLLLSLASAWWLARRWVQPLMAIQKATGRIARGDLGVRLDIDRTDEIGDVVRNVNDMAQSLQGLEGARRRWVADISHELRTPLAVLRGELEAVLDGVRPLDIKALQSLQEEVLRLGALVNDLHLLAMSDLKALPCHFGGVNAVALVKGLEQRFATRAGAKGLSLTVDPGVNPEIDAQWDAARIEQLLGNLLENSLRYTDAPGQILCSVRRAGEQVELTVEDSAPGVKSVDLPRLFDPLYRADSARSREAGGSGLGLAICLAIVKAHGGRMMASASGMGGLAVRITLPVIAKAVG